MEKPRSADRRTRNAELPDCSSSAMWRDLRATVKPVRRQNLLTLGRRAILDVSSHTDDAYVHFIERDNDVGSTEQCGASVPMSCVRPCDPGIGEVISAAGNIFEYCLSNL